ncbi:hypothetical protein [Legionella sp. 227]|uniref:hypothetical protein n=1 Tax=Legionella sp. 227 TaxID=3367288 RepID=UPI00370D16CE
MNTPIRDYFEQREREEKARRDDTHLDEVRFRDVMHQNNNDDLDDEFDAIRSIN